MAHPPARAMTGPGLEPGLSGSGGLVRLYHVSKAYLAGSWALRDVNLELSKGELPSADSPKA